MADKEKFADEYKLSMPLAEQGDANAQYSLGKICSEGLVVSKNYTVA
ncbi:MAG: hypothetical protein HOB18_06885 [Nitrospina sp.]|jgi:hypothetical protein|nr:hypothetical protein [Nitrospina sp.]